MKKIMLVVCLLTAGLPLFAMDSQSAESIRYYNSSSTGGFGSSSAVTNYYGLNKTPAVEDDSEVLLDPPAKVKRPARQIKVNTVDDEEEFQEPGQTYADAMDKRTPMTYEQFPKNYDSSNSMMMMQGGMGGMMPGMF